MTKKVVLEGVESYTAIVKGLDEELRKLIDNQQMLPAVAEQIMAEYQINTFANQVKVVYK